LPQTVATLAQRAAGRRVELWAMDEARFGLQTIQRRRITLRGVKPIGRYQHEFANFYVFGAVAPRTGAGWFAAHLALNGDEFQSFLDTFAAEQPDSFHILMLDNAKAHQAKTLCLPDNVALLFQPPYAPEVNPAERVWLALKDDLAWALWDDLVRLQDQVAALVEGWDDKTLQSLIAYPFLLDAINALPS
jgi:hypothetical protein